MSIFQEDTLLGCALAFIAGFAVAALRDLAKSKQEGKQ